MRAKFAVGMVPVDLAEIAASLAAEFGGACRKYVPARGGGRRGCVALADEERVRQIGRILVENAILYTPAGTEIHLSSADTDDGSSFWSRTRGLVLPDDQQHVFERFYRSGSAGYLGLGSTVINASWRA